MISRNRNALITLVICLIIAVASMTVANLVQTGFGDIDVVTASFSVDNGGDTYDITYKLYIPEGADASDPRPAILCLHGYQNDQETSAAYAIEAARRGIVAVCIDDFGHVYNWKPMKASLSSNSSS